MERISEICNCRDLPGGMGVPFDKLRALSLSKWPPVCGTGVAARLGL
jgi:hypothetical protein